MVLHTLRLGACLGFRVEYLPGIFHAGNIGLHRCYPCFALPQLFGFPLGVFQECLQQLCPIRLKGRQGCAQLIQRSVDARFGVGALWGLGGVGHGVLSFGSDERKIERRAADELAANALRTSVTNIYQTGGRVEGDVAFIADTQERSAQLLRYLSALGCDLKPLGYALQLPT